MADYRKVFMKQHVLLIVVHAESVPQVQRNVAIARANGADGVFLINHKVTVKELERCYLCARDKHPDFWIGLNFLGLRSGLAIDLVSQDPSVSGLWLDDIGITDENIRNPVVLLAKTLRSWQRERHGEHALIFGGVAFKYQKPVRNVALVAELAAPCVDVVTTSGEATGVAASVEKIRTMKEAIGSAPLAIASGITPENVGRYLEHADCFLVATGVSDSHAELNPARVRKLVHAISS